MTSSKGGMVEQKQFVGSEGSSKLSWMIELRNVGQNLIEKENTYT